MSTIHRIVHHIFFMYVLCHVCIYVIFDIFWYLFIGLSFYQLYVMFSISSFVSFDEIYAKLYT